MLKRLVPFVVLVFAVALLGCGDSETTTVIRETPAETIERTTTVEAPTAQSKPASSSSKPTSEPPNVVGIPLPEARRMLKSAGYRTVANNTDTALGIIVPENYTICRQGPPRGDLVVVLAQKYGC